ncbi:MAG TPA: hypothetical protein VFM18_18035 [Methanosarcina sp.]|nr:hypothetical protein [Methanosarcina sp.]
MSYLISLFVFCICVTAFGYVKMHQVSSYENGYGIMFFVGAIVSLVLLLALLLMTSWQATIVGLLIIGMLLFAAFANSKEPVVEEHHDENT